MEKDIDFLIEFFKKYSQTSKMDIEEQGATGEAPAGRAVKKWESGRTFGKTYMNDPKYVWTSGRQMGKTGGSDFA